MIKLKCTLMHTLLGVRGQKCILWCVILSAMRKILCLPCYQRAINSVSPVCVCVSVLCSSVAVQYICLWVNTPEGLGLYSEMNQKWNKCMCMGVYVPLWELEDRIWCQTSVMYICASSPIVGRIAVLTKTIPSSWWSLWHHPANIKTRCGATCDLTDQREPKS